MDEPDSGKTLKDEQFSAEDLSVLCSYMDLADPLKPVLVRSLLLLGVSVSTYLILGFSVPDNPGAWHWLVSWLQADFGEFEFWVERYLIVPDELRWNRLLMLCYLSLYIGMWWAYFASKKSDNSDIEARRLKIQTLRRLLGITAKQWQPHAVSSGDDDEAIGTFREKGAAGMEVIAILIAVSILIFDQISNIWMRGGEFSLWQYSILWTGMLCAVISFICFMMCVDALDTIFNRFSSDPVRNILVKYFYDYTINPRYVATATMLLSIILLLGYHSEMLASLAIAVILWVGYKLWFPDIRERVVDLGGGQHMVVRRHYPWHIVLLLFPLMVRGITYIVYA